MIEKTHPKLSVIARQAICATNLPIGGKQYTLLSLSRSSFYYQPRGETALNLTLMRKIDEQFMTLSENAV